MRREPQARTKKAHALTNPKPTYVSLVRAGANKTPFTAVRSATLEGQEAENFIMSTKQHEIAKITFKSDTFADEAAVKSWLDKGGYVDFTIKADDKGGFEVIGDETLTDIKRVEANGVIVYVGKAAEGTDAAETPSAEAVAKGTSETRAAAVSTSVAKSEDKPAETAPAPAAAGTLGAEGAVVEGTVIDGTVVIEGTLTAADPVQPVAPVDVEAAVASAKSVIAHLGAHGVEVVARKGQYTVSELGYILTNLSYLCEYPDGYDLSESDVEILKNAAASLITVLVTAMQGTIDGYVNRFKAEQDEAATRAKSEPSQEMQALMARLDALEKGHATLTSENATLKAAKDAAEAATAEAETRAKAAEDARRQTRKSADVEDAGTSSPQPRTAKTDAELSDNEWVERRMRTESLGISYRG